MSGEVDDICGFRRVEKRSRCSRGTNQQSRTRVVCRDTLGLTLGPRKLWKREDSRVERRITHCEHCWRLRCSQSRESRERLAVQRNTRGDADLERLYQKYLFLSVDQ